MNTVAQRLIVSALQIYWGTGSGKRSLDVGFEDSLFFIIFVLEKTVVLSHLFSDIERDDILKTLSK